MSAEKQYNVVVDKNVVVEEHELMVGDNKLKETREVSIFGDVVTLKHVRWINDDRYEVYESRNGQEVTAVQIDTSMEGNDEIEAFKQQWELMWQPTISQEEIDDLAEVEEDSASEGVKPRELVAKESEGENNSTTEDEESRVEQTDSPAVNDMSLILKSVNDIEDMAAPPEPMQLMNVEVGQSNQETIHVTSKENRMKMVPANHNEEELSEPMEMEVSLKTEPLESVTLSANGERDGMSVKVMEAVLEEANDKVVEEKDESDKQAKKKSSRKHFFDFFRRNKKNKAAKGN